MKKSFHYTITKKLDGTLARAGEIHTPHGVIQTPAFITVGTAATVKALTPDQVQGIGAQAVLANTYHLHLRPGEEVVSKAGGLGEFMGWSGPTFTDSGGFQVFSLGEAFGKGVGKVASGDDVVDDVDQRVSQAKKAKIDDDGVDFFSHINGDPLRLTPEISMSIQHRLAADIIFAFDECTSPLATKEYQQVALDRTYAWAKRCLTEHQRLSKTDKDQIALFGVVQGGRHQDLRRIAAEQMASLDFDGFGIGGSFSKEDLSTAVRWVNEILPEDKPRHLLGIGEPIDLFLGVENGIDTFDCVSPTRIARNGSVYTPDGRVNLVSSKYVDILTPIQKGCKCYTCQTFTVSYLHHLLKAKEMLSATLLSIHNLYFVTHLVTDIRASIIDGSFATLKQDRLARYYKENI